MFLLKSSCGVTLIELLISLAILGIMMCFGLSFTPSLHHKNQLQIITDEIKVAINMAKIQSIISGDTLNLTHLVDSKDWSDGMLLFVDNKTHHYGAEDVLLHEWHWKPMGFHTVWHGFQSKDYLIFSTDIRQNTTNGFFDITTPTQQKTMLVVNRLGRVRIGAKSS